MISSLIRCFSSTNSTPSLEARNRRERCWFILARGAWWESKKAIFLHCMRLCRFIILFQLLIWMWVVILNKLSSGCRFLLVADTYHPIDGHVENSPGAHNVEQTVNVLENGDHHLIFIFRSRSVDEEIRMWGVQRCHVTVQQSGVSKKCPCFPLKCTCSHLC